MLKTKPKTKPLSQTDYEKGHQAALDGKAEKDSPWFYGKYDTQYSVGRNRHNNWLKGFNAGLKSK